MTLFILLSLLYIILLFLFLKISKDFSDYLEKRKSDSTKTLLNEFKKEKRAKEKQKIFYDSYYKQLIIRRKREYFEWIPFSVSVLEYIFFSLITLFVFDFTFILKCFTGWMAIKCIGGYASWSDVIFGRANFYTFLLRSIFNITLALMSGIIIKILWMYAI